MTKILTDSWEWDLLELPECSWEMAKSLTDNWESSGTLKAQWVNVRTMKLMAKKETFSLGLFDHVYQPASNLFEAVDLVLQ